MYMFFSHPGEPLYTPGGPLAQFEKWGVRFEECSVPFGVILDLLCGGGWGGAGLVGKLMDLSEKLKKSLHLFSRRLHV